MNNGFTEEQLKQFDDWMHGKWSQHGEDGIEKIMTDAVLVAIEQHKTEWKGDGTRSDFINQPITGKEMCFVIRALAYLCGVNMLYEFTNSHGHDGSAAKDAWLYYEWCRLGLIARGENGTYNIQRDWFGLMASGIPADLIWDIEAIRGQHLGLVMPSHVNPGRELQYNPLGDDSQIMTVMEDSRHAAFQIYDGPTADPTHALTAFLGQDGVIHALDSYHNGQGGTEDLNEPIRDRWGKSVGRWLNKAGTAFDDYGLYLALENTASPKTEAHQRCIYDGLSMTPTCPVNAAYQASFMDVKLGQCLLCGNTWHRQGCQNDAEKLCKKMSLTAEKNGK